MGYQALEAPRLKSPHLDIDVNWPVSKSLPTGDGRKTENITFEVGSYVIVYFLSEYTR